MSRFVKLAIIGVLGVSFCLLGDFLGIWTQFPIFWPREEFSKEAWAGTHPHRRYIYFQDLKNRNLLDNLTKQEVENLLGKPESKAGGDQLSGYVVQHKSDHYLSFDAITILRIRFDHGDFVEEYFLETD